MNDRICVSRDGRDIYINIMYSKRKSIGLEIRNDLTVNLRAPYFVSKRDVLKFIESKKDWLFATYEEAVSLKAENVEISFKDIYYDGALLPYKGENCIRLNIIKAGESQRATIDYDLEEKIISIATMSENPEFIRECVVDVYRKLARLEFEEKAAYYAERMGVTYNRIAVKEQKTKWGSCSGKKNLNFNWKLILMPESVLDYIVVHELAHLIEMNHSSAFWAQVAKIMPDYKKRVAWLRKNEKEYVKF